MIRQSGWRGPVRHPGRRGPVRQPCRRGPARQPCRRGPARQPGRRGPVRQPGRRGGLSDSPAGGGLSDSPAGGNSEVGDLQSKLTVNRISLPSSSLNTTVMLLSILIREQLVSVSVKHIYRVIYKIALYCHVHIQCV